MLGLGLLWLLHKEYASSISFSLNFLFICLGTSVCIFIFSPNISWYVGMSGVLHGIFAWGVIIDMYYKRKSAYLLLVGLIVKLIDEQYFASSSFMAELIEVGVAVNAHLYGSIFGIFSGLIGASMLHFSDKQSHA
jgi:rhomboid family GlyGly-CTERM serine protease